MKPPSRWMIFLFQWINLKWMLFFVFILRPLVTRFSTTRHQENLLEAKLVCSYYSISWFHLRVYFHKLRNIIKCELQIANKKRSEAAATSQPSEWQWAVVPRKLWPVGTTNDAPTRVVGRSLQCASLWWRSASLSWTTWFSQLQIQMSFACSRKHRGRRTNAGWGASLPI